MSIELGSAAGKIEIDASGVTAGIQAAQAALRGAESSLASIGGAATSAGAGLMKVGAPLAGLGAAAAKTAGDFEASMNVLGVAARDSGVSVEELRQVALKAGTDITLVGVGAADVAGAMTNFAKAGLNVNQTLGDMNGYLNGTAQMGGALRAAIDLAAASELDLNQASQLVVTTMSTFGLSADQAVGAMSNYVQAADASVASVGDLAAAMENIGPTMAAFGIPLEDVNTALAILSTRGIKGAEAGTALKSMFVNLMRDTPEVNAALEALNITLYDQQGNMRSMEEIIGQLAGAMKGLTEEERNQYVQTLAGTYGMKAMNTLLAEGTAGWENMTTAIGSAATMQESAAARTQGFNTAMENLKSTVETFLINVGTPLIRDVLTPLVAKITEVLGSLATLNPELLKWGVIIGGVTVALGGVLVVLGQVALAIEAISLPVAAVIAAIAALGLGFVALKTHLDASRQAATDQAAQIAITSTSYAGYLTAMQDAGLRTDALTQDVYELIQAHKDQADAAQLTEYVAKLTEWQQQLQELNSQLLLAEMQMVEYGGVIDEGTVKERARIEALKEQITQYAALNPIFAEMAVKAGLLTAEEVKLAEAQGVVAKGLGDVVKNGALAGAALGQAGKDLEGFKGAADGVAKAVSDLSKAWEQAWKEITDATTKYKDENQRQIMEFLGNSADEYTKYAISIAKLESEKQQALIKIEEEAADIRAKLEKAGNQAGLAALAEAVQAKQSATVAYYNSRIKTEQAGEQTILNVAMEYARVSLNVLLGTLRQQLAAQVANMNAMVKAVAGGYASMAASVDAYNKVVAGQDALAATQAAISDVLKAFQGIEAAGVKAAADATAEFNNWNQASGSLSDALADVGVNLDDIGKKAGSAGGASSVTTKIVDPIEEAAKTVERISGMVKAAKEAFDQLIDYGGPQPGWEVGFELLLEGVKSMVTAVAETVDELKRNGLFDVENAETGSGPIARILAFMGAVSALGDAIPKAVEALGAIGRYEDKPILAPIKQITYWVNEILIAAAYWAQKLGDEALADAKTFSEAAGGVAKLVTDGIAALDALAKWKKIEEPLRVAELASYLNELVNAIAYYGKQMSSVGFAAAKDFADAAGDVAGIVAEGLAAIDELAQWDAPQLPAELIANIQGLAEYLRLLVEAFAHAGQQVGDLGKAAKAFAKVAGPVVGLVKAGLDAFDALWNFEGPLNDSYEVIHRYIGKMEGLGVFIGMLVGAIATTNAHLDPKLQDAAKAFAEKASSVVGLVKNGLDAFNALWSFEGPLNDSYDVIHRYIGKMEGLGTFIGMLVGAIATTTANLDPKLQDAAKAFAEKAGPVVGIVAGALDAFNKLAEWEPPAAVTDLLPRINELSNFIAQLALAIGTAAGLVAEDLQQAAKTLTDNAGGAVGLVVDAVAAVGALAEWDTSALDEEVLKERIKDLAAYIQLLATEIGSQAKLVGADALKAAKELSDAFDKVMNLVTGGLKTFGDIEAWLPKTDNAGLTTRIQQIAEFITLLARQLGEQAVLLGGATLDAANKFANAAGPIVSIAGGALTAISNIGKWVPEVDAATLTERLQRVTEFVKALAQGLGEAAELLGDEAIKAANAFANSVEPVLKTTGSALELLVEFGESVYKVPTEATATWMMSRINGFLGELTKGLGEGNAQYGTLLGSLKTFVENVGTTLTTLKDALETLKQIGELQAPAVGLAWVSQLVTAMQMTVPSLTGVLQQIAGLFAAFKPSGYDAGLGFMETLASGIRAGLGEVEAALQAVGDLFPKSPAKAGPLRKAPNWANWMLPGLDEAAVQVAGILQAAWAGMRTGFGDVVGTLARGAALPAGALAPAYAGGYAGPGMGATPVQQIVNLNVARVGDDVDVEVMAYRVAEVLQWRRR